MSCCGVPWSTSTTLLCPMELVGTASKSCLTRPMKYKDEMRAAMEKPPTSGRESTAGIEWKGPLTTWLDKVMTLYQSEVDWTPNTLENFWRKFLRDNERTLPLSDRSRDFRLLKKSDVRYPDRFASPTVQGRPRPDVFAFGHERPRKHALEGVSSASGNEGSSSSPIGRYQKRQKLRKREEGRSGDRSDTDPSSSSTRRLSNSLMLPPSYNPSSCFSSVATLPPTSAHSSSLSGYDTETTYTPCKTSGSRRSQPSEGRWQ